MDEDSSVASSLPVAVTPLPVSDQPAWDRKPSLASQAVGAALRVGLHPIMHRIPSRPQPIRAARAAIDRAAVLVPTGTKVRVERVRDPHVHTGHVMKAEWIIPPEADQSAAVLYLHGGGYVICSPRTHRPITARLAVDTGLPVLAPRYRLAPEHPFPAALEDAVEAYKWLLARGYSRIIVAGDSAGGHLAASLAGEISRTNLPTPAGVVLYSPWVDLTCEMSAVWDKLVRDPYLSGRGAQRVGRLVAGKVIDPRLALLSCEWGALPPFLIQVGGAEVLRPEAEAFADVLRAAGASVDLQVWPGQMHVFQILNRFVPEADAAMRETSTFVAAALEATSITLTVVA